MFIFGLIDLLISVCQCMYFLATAMYSGKHLVLGLQIYMDFILLIIIVQLLLLLHKHIIMLFLQHEKYLIYI